MWADPQRDGHPSTARVPCSNAANIEERKTWTQSEYIYTVPAQETAKHCATSGWPPLSDVGAVTKPTRETRSYLLGYPKLVNRYQPLTFTVLWEHVEEILLFNKFFWLSIYTLVAKMQPDKVVPLWTDGEFLAIFLRPVFQRSACSTFQTCTLNRAKATSYVEVW